MKLLSKLSSIYFWSTVGCLSGMVCFIGGMVCGYAIYSREKEDN